MILRAYGSHAALLDLAIEAAPDRSARTLALAESLREAWPQAEVIVGAGSVAVVGVSIDEVRCVASRPVPERPREEPRAHLIAVAYDGEDLASVAEAVGISVPEAVARHAAADYVVDVLGFQPGFAYLACPAGAPLAVPRRSSPRPRVPAGSVAVAAAYTAVYPFASPGGWNLLGRAIDAVPFDAFRDPPVLFAPGDRVRFVPHEGPIPAPPAPVLDPPAASRGLAVLTAPACATVQDLGRRGQLGRGIPPSGALDPETLAAANLAAGNAAGAAAIEIPLGALEVEARGVSAWISIDGDPAVLLRDGERLRVPTCDRAVRYLAVRGGVAVPEVLGARATLLSARLGGLAGRPLRKRDVIPIGDETAGSPQQVDPIRDPVALIIDPGPQVDRFPAGALDAFLAAAWRVSRLGDRVGVRLEGARVPREGPDRALPVPMVRGAVEITTDGTPIVLGPDHPTTGGYPVLAVLRPEAQAALARRKPGDEVRFVIG